MDGLDGSLGGDDDERICLLYLSGRRNETRDTMDECVRMQADAPRSTVARLSCRCRMPTCAARFLRAPERVERSEALPAVSSLEK
jgi:hypothetical protein